MHFACFINREFLVLYLLQTLYSMYSTVCTEYIQHLQHALPNIILTWPLAALKWILHIQMTFVGPPDWQIQNAAVFGLSTRVKSIGSYPLSSLLVCVFLSHSPLSPPPQLEAKQASSVPWEDLSTADNGPFTHFGFLLFVHINIKACPFPPLGSGALSLWLICLANS